MVLSAVFFGSIGTLVETSEAQRSAFNTAFGSFGIDIFWGRETYQSLLVQPGGRNRIANALDEAGFEHDQGLVDAIYTEKTSLFVELLRAGVQPRAGTVNLLEQASQSGLATALVSGTDKSVINALLEGAIGLSASSFDLILTGEDAQNPKSTPDLYNVALSQLGVHASDCIAIEDTVTGGQSAQATGIPVLYTPGEMTQKQDWSSVKDQITSLNTLGMNGSAVHALRMLHGDQIQQRAA